MASTILDVDTWATRLMWITSNTKLWERTCWTAHLTMCPIWRMSTETWRSFPIMGVSRTGEGLGFWWRFLVLKVVKLNYWTTNEGFSFRWIVGGCRESAFWKCDLINEISQQTWNFHSHPTQQAFENLAKAFASCHEANLTSPASPTEVHPQHSIQIINHHRIPNFTRFSTRMIFHMSFRKLCHSNFSLKLAPFIFSGPKP